MPGSPYDKFRSDELILRDELAIDRTLLANERTVLAYLRSAVSLVIAGLTIIHFATNTWFMLVGMACVPGGVATGIFGMKRYRKMNKAISISRSNVDGKTSPAGSTHGHVPPETPSGEPRPSSRSAA